MAEKSYFKPEDLKKFGNITKWSETLGKKFSDHLVIFPNFTKWSETLGKKFFDYYGEVFKEGALTAREKALIALAVSHAVQCPYCIDAYTNTCVEKGAEEEEMMEAVHVAAAIKSGATLVYGVQMMNHNDKISM